MKLHSFEKKAYGTVFILIIATVSGYFYYTTVHDPSNVAYKTPQEADSAVRFDMEIYDSILLNYWQVVDESKFAELFRLALTKASTTIAATLPSTDRAGVAAMLGEQFAHAGENERQQLAIDTATIVLFNLEPFGRSGLLSQEDEQKLRDTVNNVDRSTDLYATLGVAKESSPEAIAQAYIEKKETLGEATSTEAKEELAVVERAYGVLKEEQTKEIYDVTKMEPTVTFKTMDRTLYIDMSKVSPASFTEFMSFLSNTDKMASVDSLIIDLRGNLGGALDFTAYFLGLFFGPNQYAFDLYRKNDYDVQRTPSTVAKLETLGHLEDVAVLVDGVTQSTAELTASALRHFRIARVVGTKTRGWGSVENTFPLETDLGDGKKYSLFLVHSLTVQDNNLPIEGNGVTPDIDIGAANWRSQLAGTFASASLKDAIMRVLAE